MTRRLSLKERAEMLEQEKRQLNCEKGKRLTRFNEAQQAFFAIEQMYKRSIREWVYIQRAHAQTERKFAKVMKQLKDAGESTQEQAARKRGSSAE